MSEIKGSGCKNCPVIPCETMNYRGSTCSAQRAKFGLGDPMTNGDRIRAMSDEELAELLRDAYDAGSDDAEAWHFGEGHRYSFEWDLEWLKRPAKEET